MSRIASRTLTPAIMPSKRLVVSRFPAVMNASSSVRRARLGAERRLCACVVELADDADAVVGHLAELFDRRLETREFAPQVVDSRLEAVAHVLSCVGKEEV